MSGCDVEIVFEVKPKAGGGVDMSFSFPLFAFTREKQLQLRQGTAAWISDDGEHGEALHFLVQTRALQIAQNMPCADYQPEDKYEEIASFALTFVCQATGARVNAQMSMQMSDFSWLPSGDLSRNASQPTRWHEKGQAAAHQHHAPTFEFKLTPEQAPESCGVMFFDPLFEPPAGDGLVLTPASEDSWEASRGSSLAPRQGAGAVAAGLAAAMWPW